MGPKPDFMAKQSPFVRRMEKKHPGWLIFTRREFMRKKYETLRLKFPRTPQTAIVEKMNNQWDAKTDQDKFNLFTLYEQGNAAYMIYDGMSSDSSMAQPFIPRPLQKLSEKEEYVKRPTIHHFKEEGQIMEEKEPPMKQDMENYHMKKKMERQQQEQLEMEELEDQQRILDKKNKGKLENEVEFNPDARQEDLDEESSIVLIQQVEKSRKKQSNNQEYLNFYKYYFQRLVSEHPKWTKSNVDTIISLLWKKRMMTETEKKKAEKMKKKEEEPVSGYIAFKRAKLQEGLSQQEIDRVWNPLPFECKRYWELKGGKVQNRRPPVLTPSQLLKKGNEASREIPEVPENPLRKLFTTKITINAQVQISQEKEKAHEQGKSAVLRSLFGSSDVPNPFSWMNRK